MKLIVADFETYYDGKLGYTLTKMQTDAYILDPRFEVIGVSIAVDDAAPVWFSGTMDETQAWLNQFDWTDAAVCCHNTLFDGFIFSQRFGIYPKRWMDTLSMARELYPWLPSHSLANVAKHLGLGAKGDAVIHAEGKRLADFSPAGLAAYGAYCMNDTILCRDMCRIMMPSIPSLDLRLIDMTVRMFTEPKFVGNIPMLEQAVIDEGVRKDALLVTANIDKAIVMSNMKFALALTALYVAPPRKLNPKGELAWAFAKSDEAFTNLQHHDDPSVQALVMARLGVKSTIAETRAQRMLDTARRGLLPVYANHWGAKVTGRSSGGNQINWLNLPARGPSAGIRQAIGAPIGHKVIVGDSSNIELRIAMMAAGQTDVLDDIRASDEDKSIPDVYCKFASTIYGREVTKKDRSERNLGKTSMLSLQFGTGAGKFKNMARLSTGQQITEDMSQLIVQKYRYKHSAITAMWHKGDNRILPAMYNRDGLIAFDVNGWCLTHQNGIGLPGSPGIRYHDLQRDFTGAWVYTMGRTQVKTYGANVFQNMVQHLARQVVMWQTELVNRRYQVVLSVYDEIVCIEPDVDVEACKAYILECLGKAPPWCIGLPLAGEVSSGQTYGDAK